MPQSAQNPLLARLPLQCLVNPDAKTRAFTDWWLRMHRGRRPLVSERLRFVGWAEVGQTTQRFVWEVCRWPSGDSARWMFVCWLLDEVGMWWKVFPSKRSALEYLRQAPEVVMARKSSGHGDEVEKQAS